MHRPNLLLKLFIEVYFYLYMNSGCEKSSTKHQKPRKSVEKYFEKGIFCSVVEKMSDSVPKLEDLPPLDADDVPAEPKKRLSERRKRHRKRERHILKTASFVHSEFR